MAHKKLITYITFKFKTFVLKHTYTSLRIDKSHTGRKYLQTIYLIKDL